MNISAPIVLSREVTAVSFAFYSTEEIHKLSVKRITSPILFDALNHPNKGGLYDPALGPLDRNSLYGRAALAPGPCVRRRTATDARALCLIAACGWKVRNMLPHVQRVPGPPGPH